MSRMPDYDYGEDAAMALLTLDDLRPMIREREDTRILPEQQEERDFLCEVLRYLDTVIEVLREGH